VSSNPVGNSTTMRIDVSGDTNLETQFVGAGAVSESFLGSNTGALFTANSLSDSVSEFTTITTNSQVFTINVPAGSKPIAVTSARSGFVYALNSSPNANCAGTGSISVINTTSLVNSSTVCVGVNPVSFAQMPVGTKIYVANQGDNTVSVFDPDLGVVAATLKQSDGIGLSPAYVVASPNSSYIFVVNKGDGTNPGSLNIIATYNNTVAATVPLGVGPTFEYIDTHLNRLYVTNTVGNSVTVFDISNVQPANNPPMPTLATVTVGTAPVGVTALQDGTRFYVADSGSDDVAVVSATSFGVLKMIPVGQDPVWVASDPGSTKVYSANADGGSVSIIQTSNDSLVTSMAAPQQNPSCTSSCGLQQPRMILTF
jgi:YVTN family beta-propeller protein